VIGAWLDTRSRPSSSRWLYRRTSSRRRHLLNRDVAVARVRRQEFRVDSAEGAVLAAVAAEARRSI